VSEELSIDAVIRGATVEFWACKPELQSRAHINTQRGNAFIERIVFFPDPSNGRKPEINEKLRLRPARPAEISARSGSAIGLLDETN
jgi:hypothetical protein